MSTFALWYTPIHRPYHSHLHLPLTLLFTSSFSNLPILRDRRRKHCTSVNTGLRSSYSLLSPMDSSSPPQGYRPNVGICLMNPSKQIFAASRLDFPTSWQMPQGGIDDGEDAQTAAIRELREETGLTSVQVLGEVPCWLTYDFPSDVREKLKRQWGSDWKGQAQKWFLLKFTGNENEINLLGDGKEKPEFGKWSWMAPEQVLELAVDFKKPVYAEVLKAFASHLQ